MPGIFFDLNPARRRDLFDSPCHHFIRFSYGPKMATLEKGCDGIERVVNKFRALEKRGGPSSGTGPGAEGTSGSVGILGGA